MTLYSALEDIQEPLTLPPSTSQLNSETHIWLQRIMFVDDMTRWSTHGSVQQDCGLCKDRQNWKQTSPDYIKLNR